ncbi:hypothetical protein A3D81_00145 [Candidatus Curtissbacteria bacterium RIFCSPHIGHO2_02_FULL_40_17]|uniref:Uncharacterized protein n=3 Tax=Candidatus Curtissiibacteriota TaxID=1752717 RepID=A0A1F5GH93_9BACT|nr:MAG: hypothetical protein A2693_00045 [Candidatus Curtissbacteria bacterium RIFCSPHIGHO2_01_FULL_40_12]OGD91241.1 MAG: hypothetical protein A3D81_00145 [Candidatus Curtissbacteria bacterium RIFCSPHIGHO2_02_FULL_40_17]OGE07878.1 MAG: hypothetical protein A3I53_04305 [Candidatus Curtissbacteria bacterium RIFCSPLOWO2_02_FULL_40_13b]
MPKSRILSLIIPFLLFSLTLTVYILTLSRSVYFGDSGEFIAVAKTLGIAHPPGYPLYTMLAHLFTYLPFGNIAFKVNLFSAVTSSLTIVVVYFACLKLTKNRLASASASLFLAFSYLFWLYSLVAEVFSLNNLFVATIILISLHILEKPHQKKLFFLLAFVFGLALTNHHTIILLAPALLFLILSTTPKLLLNPKFIILNTLFILVGLLPYLYLPLRALQDPILNWGDPDTLGKFLHHFLRRDYGTFSFGAGSTKPFNLQALSFYLSSLPKDFVAVGTLLTILGFLYSFIISKEKRAYFYLVIAYLFVGPIFIFLTRLQVVGNIDAKGAVERFFLTSHVLIAVYLAIGLSQVIKLIPKPLNLPANLLVFIFLAPLIVNFNKVDQSKNFIYETYGQKVFESLPADSAVIVAGDHLSMVGKYLQFAKSERPDLKIINFTLLTDQWYKEILKRQHPDFSFPYDKFQFMKLSETEAGEIICQELIGKFPAFIENRSKGFAPENNKYCTNRIDKFLWKLEPKDYKGDEEDLLNQYQNFWQPQLETLKPQKIYDFRTRAVLLYSYSQPLTYLGSFVENYSDKQEKAFEIFQEAYAISEDNAIALNAMAQKYVRENDIETAIQLKKKAIKINPTLADSYQSLGFLYLQKKNDKKTAIYYFRKYLQLVQNPAEQKLVTKIIKDLEKDLSK